MILQETFDTRFEKGPYPFQTPLLPLPTGYIPPPERVGYLFQRGDESIPKGHYTSSEGVGVYPGRDP
ncbi:MAG: hypothetical protein ACP5E3_16450 [Bacteroidales bacterium]